MTSRRGASMPTGARISIDVLALPVKSAARAALLTAPLVRSSKPRAVAASTNSAPASSASVPVGAADRGANWISRASDIDRFLNQVQRRRYLRFHLGYQGRRREPSCGRERCTIRRRRRSASKRPALGEVMLLRSGGRPRDLTSAFSSAQVWLSSRVRASNDLVRTQGGYLGGT